MSLFASVFLGMLALLAFPGAALAQFEGKIVYGMTYENYPNSSIDLLSKLPQQTIMYINGESILFEQSVHGGGSQKFISNSSTHERYLWMNLVGESFLVMLPEELPQDVDTLVNAIGTGAIKTIAGYKCHEAKVVTSSDTVLVWYTKDFETHVQFQQFKNLDGFPLQYEVKSSDGSKITLSAISVEPTAVPPAVFERPAGLAQLSLEEFQKTFRN